MERADPPRPVSFAGADELAVRRRAEPAVRHRERRGAAAPADDRRRVRRRARQARPAAQVLSQLSAHARRQRRHAARAAGSARFLPRLLPLQERRLAGNNPHPLKARTAAEMAQIPTYYVMERDKGMAATVAPMMPSAAEIAACKWLTEAEVEVYATEYARTQFTGALQGYRVRRGSDPKSQAEMRTFSGRAIDVPSMFVGGSSDWGVYQTPGAVDRMRSAACSRMVGFHLVDGAGHWVQQEQPEQVSRLLIQFLHDQRAG